MGDCYSLAHSAYRHGIDRDDTIHALINRIQAWPLAPEPPARPAERILVIGPARDGQLLEIVYLTTDTGYRVIHSMKLRPSTLRGPS